MDEGSNYSALAVGDSGAWVRHLPLMWRGVTDLDGNHHPPSRPRPRRRDDRDSFLDHVAWWAPLLQLTAYGCGWPRPDIGIRQWVRLGRPTDDPRLALLDRRWGPKIDDFLAWVCTSPYFTYLLSRSIAEATNTTVDDKPIADE